MRYRDYTAVKVLMHFATGGVVKIARASGGRRLELYRGYKITG